jgi:hypothetical protein
MSLTSRGFCAPRIALLLDEVPREESLAGLRSSTHWVLLETIAFKCGWAAQERPR